MKIVGKRFEKVFTKDLRKGIIIKNHIPLKVNYKNLFEKDWLFMDKTKEVLLKEENVLVEKFAKSEKFIGLLKKICNDLKIENYKVEIKKFLENSKNNIG